MPADCYDSGTVRGWAEEARQALDTHGGSETELAEALDLQPSVAAEIYQRILRKLAAEPIELSGVAGEAILKRLLPALGGLVLLLLLLRRLRK